MGSAICGRDTFALVDLGNGLRTKNEGMIVPEFETFFPIGNILSAGYSRGGSADIDT